MADSDLSAFPGMTAKVVFQFKVCYLVAFWLEATLYGLYVSLFVVALNIMLRRQALDNTSSRVFLTGIVVMFLIISFHNSTNVYRMLFAYGKYDPNSPNRAVAVLLDWSHWDAYAFPIVASLVTWIGDILVIYRCFVIWQKNIWVIVLPVLVLLGSIATTAVNLYWLRHPTSIPFHTMDKMFKVTYPLNAVLNVLTTSLIAYRLHQQYKRSTKAGFDASSRFNYITIMRIIVESALMYTVLMVVMAILWYTGHPAVVIVQHMFLPSIGIVFVMIAIRAHVSKKASSMRSGGSHTINGIIPTWLTSRDETGREPTPRSARMRFMTSTVEGHRLEALTSNKGRLDDLSEVSSPIDGKERAESALDDDNYYGKS